MNIFRLNLVVILSILTSTLILTQVFAQEFEQTVKQKHFYITPSQKNLSKLHQASTLIITCVDFRIQDEIERFLTEELNLKDNYDEIAIPGASLALVQKKYKNWSATIKDTIGILKNLHGIKRVIFIDHMNCGAYKLIKGQKLVANEKSEYNQHVITLKEAKKNVKNIFPDLDVYSFIMYLDGNIEQIGF